MSVDDDMTGQDRREADDVRVGLVKAVAAVADRLASMRPNGSPQYVRAAMAYRKAWTALMIHDRLHHGRIVAIPR